MNRVKWAAQRKRIEKRSERDGEAYGKSVNDLVDVICSSEYYKKKLIWMGRYRWMDGLFCLVVISESIKYHFGRTRLIFASFRTSTQG